MHRRPGFVPKDAKRGGPDDPLRLATEWLRSRAGPEARSAVMLDTRVDIFRVKDFARVLAEKQPAWLATLPQLAAVKDKPAAEQAAFLGVRRRAFLSACPVAKAARPRRCSSPAATSRASTAW